MPIASFGGRFVEQDRELVAAEARRGVAVTDVVPNPLRDVDEEQVSRVVAEGVVDHLEAVEITEQHSDRHARTARPGDRVVEPVAQQRAVGEAGQVIVERLVFERCWRRIRSEMSRTMATYLRWSSRCMTLAEISIGKEEPSLRRAPTAVGTALRLG